MGAGSCSDVRHFMDSILFSVSPIAVLPLLMLRQPLILREQSPLFLINSHFVGKQCSIWHVQARVTVRTPFLYAHFGIHDPECTCLAGRSRTPSTAGQCSYPAFSLSHSPTTWASSPTSPRSANMAAFPSQDTWKP